MKSARKLEVVPAPEPIVTSESDPFGVFSAVAEANRTKIAEEEALRVVTELRQELGALQEAYDNADNRIDVQMLAAAREKEGSAARAHGKRVKEAARAAGEVAVAESKRAAAAYAERLEHVKSWRARFVASGLLAKFEELDRELGLLVECVADFAVETSDAAERMLGLERVVRPLLGAEPQGIAAPGLEDLQFVVRVAIARSRAAGGRDCSADGFLDGVAQPDWRSASLEKFKAATAALEGTEVKS